MGAAPLGRAGGAQRFGGAGDAGQFLRVRLDDVRPGGESAAQRLPAGVQQYGDACGAGLAHQRRVRAHRDARGQAAAQCDRPHLAGQQFAVGGQEGLPLVRRDVRAGLVQLGGVTRGLVHHADRAPGVARDGHQRVGDEGPAVRPGRLGVRRKQGAQDPARLAAGEAGDGRGQAEGGQYAGDVEALAAGPFGHLAHPVGGVRNEMGHPIGQIESGIERDGQDHLRAPPSSVGQRFITHNPGENDTTAEPTVRAIMPLEPPPGDPPYQLSGRAGARSRHRGA
ncbi:hypothetical protein STAL104432_26990 [Streptomyces albus]